jgi:hypothetical protein
MVLGLLEVIGDAFFQVASLADVQRVASRLDHAVNAGAIGQRLEQLAGVEGFAFHAVRVVVGHRL